MYEMTRNENGYTMDAEFGELLISRDSAHGYRPVELLVASVTGCSYASLEVVLSLMKTDVTNMNVSVNVERKDEKIRRVEKIHLHFVIEGENLQKEKVQQAIDIGRKNCSMVQSINDSIQVTESFEIR